MEYNGRNLEEVLEEHKRYLKSYKDKDSVKYLRADFSYSTVFDINFIDVNLIGANFEGARICKCKFMNSQIDSANFKHCDFIGVKFIESALDDANFVNANFENVFFGFSVCEGADFSGAKTTNVQVIDTCMMGATNPPFVPLACPEEGSFIGWKKCISKDGKVIVKLLIPAEAKRSSATGRKCRASKAVVLDIQKMDGEHYPDVAYSIYNATHIYGTAFNYSNPDRKFEYRIGKQVETEEPFEEDRFEECASGIHFFITRQEAVNY